MGFPANRHLPEQRTARHGVLLVHIFLTTSLIGAALTCRAINIPVEKLIYPGCVAFAVLTLWIFWSWKCRTRALVDPYLLFMTAAILFNGGQVLLEIFQLNKNHLLNARFAPQTTLSSVYLLLLGLTCVHLGALISTRRSLSCWPKASHAAAPALYYRAVRRVGWVVLCLSVAPAVQIMARGFNAVMSHGYFIGLFQQDAATSFGATPNVLATLLIPGTLCLLSGSQRRPLPVIVGTFVVSVYCALNLFMGSRAPAVAALAAFLWIWHRRVRRLNRTVIASVACLMLIILPVIASVRNISGEHRSSLDPLLLALDGIDNPVVSLLSEMGYSLNTVAYTLDLVPTVRPFDIGESYFYAFLTIFPNFSWEIHPTVAHGLLSNWLIWTIDPTTAAANGGLGFSFLAEAYLNFGWYGSPLVLVVIGFLLGRLSRWCAESDDPAKSAFAACVLYFVLIFARGESAGVVRGVVWYSLFIFLAIRLVARRRSPFSWRSPVPRNTDPQCAYR